MSKRRAQLVTGTVEVHCPYCGGPQPNPDNGADTWTPAEVEAASGSRTCVDCDKEFNLSLDPRAQVLK